jgi:hypothetical protein
MNYKKIEYNNNNIIFKLTNNQDVYMYSKRDIKNQIKKEMSDIDYENSEIIFIIGNGIGEHLNYLVNRYGYNKIYFIVEPIEEIYEFYKKNVIDRKDFTNIIYTNLDKNNLDISFNKLKQTKNFIEKIYNIDFLIPNFYNRKFYDLVSSAKDYIINNIFSYALSLGNSLDDWILGIVNSLRNKEFYNKSLNLNNLKNKFKNKACIIVSAGPSLKKNMTLLEEYQDNLFIFAQDATFKLLQDKKIKPDFIFSYERDYITFEKFFKNLDKKYYKNNFILKSVVDPNTSKKIKESGGKIGYVFTKNLSLESYLGKKFKILTYPIDTGVASFSLQIASFMGFSKIILIGQDLAYSKEGYTHSEGVVLNKKVELKNNIEKVLGINGDILPTTKILKSFKTNLENIILQKSLDVIDSTEGGALIKHTKIMDLKESLNKYCKEKINKKINFEKVSINVDKINTNFKLIINDLREVESNLKKHYNEDNINISYEYIFNKVKSISFNNIYSTAKRELYLDISLRKKDKVISMRDFISDIEKINNIIGDYFQKYINNSFSTIKRKIDEEVNMIEKTLKYVEFKMPYEALNIIDENFDSVKNKNEQIKLIILKVFILTTFSIEKIRDISKALTLINDLYKNYDIKRFIINNKEFEYYLLKSINVFINYAKNLYDLNKNNEESHNSILDASLIFYLFNQKDLFIETFPKIDLNLLTKNKIQNYNTLNIFYNKIKKD